MFVEIDFKISINFLGTENVLANLTDAIKKKKKEEKQC